MNLQSNSRRENVHEICETEQLCVYPTNPCVSLTQPPVLGKAEEEDGEKCVPSGFGEKHFIQHRLPWPRM